MDSLKKETQRNVIFLFTTETAELCVSCVTAVICCLYVTDQYFNTIDQIIIQEYRVALIQVLSIIQLLHGKLQ